MTTQHAQQKPLVIFGNSDIARLAHFYFENDTDRTVAAFTADSAYCDTDTFLEKPLIPFETIAEHYPPAEYDLFVAISYVNMNKVREEKYNAAKAMGYTLPSYVSSKATYFAQHIGDNCFILEDNTLQPFVSIGNNVTLWSGNHIGHDSVIHDHCFIASHVVVSGHCTIQSNCFLGVNATLRNNITIAESCVIGAGATILKNTEPEGVYVTKAAEPHALKSSQLKRL